MTLKARFINLTSSYINENESIELLWNELESHYTESHRTYHNLTHLEELFEYYDTYKKELEKPDLVAFAIFYHDIIYGIWNKKNEEDSAEKALNVLNKTALSVNDLTTIESHILATKTHNAFLKDTQWMIDFDLAILGSPIARYNLYSELIRKEYRKVPTFLYKKGRKKMLKHFLEKPFIYSTSTFKILYEKQAKKNLQAELNSL
ncbi:hypothetical protein JCM19275_2644 [Nonlabens ulvanivorans]|uniref:Metal-dependent HD superfamily phosphohydrolase n=1 Tax=Nonlabens ulvanivorans TaxID=906888 RepID=A0A090X1Q1_NONUL|nr:hypothetical protein [Nonlabens ulvanivorans]GAL73797.1 hypothetical protein JCM19275_2644 [Nonlabens ulvanivorans]